MKKIFLFIMTAMIMCFLPSCKENNTPEGGSSDAGTTTYSGYAPNAKSLIGKWFDMGTNYVKFSYNGSSWDVKEGRMIEILRAGITIKDFTVNSGYVNYTPIDGYTATLKWEISISYTSYVYTYVSGVGPKRTEKTHTETDTGDVTLYFTSYQGGYSSGYMNGKYSSYREFSLE